MNTYTISGATGNIGRLVAEKLLADGHAVRVIGRDAERLQPLVDRGAEAFVGSLGDTAFLTSAYRGADAVFVMIPPNLQSDDYLGFQRAIARSHVAAIRGAGVGSVVALSSIGAHLVEGNGIVQGLHDLEERIKTLSTVDVLILRPAYFMENIYAQLDIIKNMGVAGSPVGAEVSQPVVATRDIAEVAADRMARLDFAGYEVQYVLGPRNLTYTAITRKLGEALGMQDLQYVEFPYEDAGKGMIQMGLSENVADLIIGLAEGLNNGRVLSHYTRTAGNTTATTIDEFAAWFARAYTGRQKQTG